MKENTLIIIGVVGFVIALLIIIIAIVAGHNSGNNSSSSSKATALIQTFTGCCLPMFVAIMFIEKISHF